MVTERVQKRIDALEKQGFKKVGEEDLGEGQTKSFYEKIIDRPESCNDCDSCTATMIGKKKFFKCTENNQKCATLEELRTKCPDDKIKVKKEVNDLNPYYLDTFWSCDERELGIVSKFDETILMKFDGMDRFSWGTEEELPNKEKDDKIKNMIKEFMPKANQIWRKDNE